MNNICNFIILYPKSFNQTYSIDFEWSCEGRTRKNLNIRAVGYKMRDLVLKYYLETIRI